jgi:hypothetical protein
LRPATEYYQGDNIKEDEMGMSCSLHGRDEKSIQNFSQKTRRENLGTDGRIILEWILENWGPEVGT